jgi:SP family myo-inositol transporter-like MFS transporter 13
MSTHLAVVARKTPMSPFTNTFLWLGSVKKGLVQISFYNVKLILFQLSFFVVLLTTCAAISGLCFGYDTGVISAALVSIRDDLGHTLSDHEKEWISTATSVGALIG